MFSQLPAGSWQGQSVEFQGGAIWSAGWTPPKWDPTRQLELERGGNGQGLCASTCQASQSPPVRSLNQFIR